MKKYQSVFLSVLFVFVFANSWGQENYSANAVQPNFSFASQSQLPSEIFRFKPGFVTQTQNGNLGQFGNSDRWLSNGLIAFPSNPFANTFGVAFQGYRSQANGRGLLVGMKREINPNQLIADALTQSFSPVIEWNGDFEQNDIDDKRNILKFKYSSDPSSSQAQTFFNIDPIDKGGRQTGAYAENGLLGHLAVGDFGGLAGTNNKWIGIGNPTINGNPSSNLYGMRTQWGADFNTFAMRQSNFFGTPLKNTIIEWGDNQFSNMNFRYVSNPTDPVNGFRQLMALTPSGSIEVGANASNLSTFNSSLLNINNLNSSKAEAVFITAGSNNTAINLNGDNFKGINIQNNNISSINNRSINISNNLDGSIVTDFNNYFEGIRNNVNIASNEVRAIGYHGVLNSPGQTNNVGATNTDKWGILQEVFGGRQSVGIEGIVNGNSGFRNIAIAGSIRSGTSITGNNWAGYFNGRVLATNGFITSDKRLKNKIENEQEIMKKILLLEPKNYFYNSKENTGFAFDENLQHGFVAQDLEKVFPELVTVLPNRTLPNEKESDIKDLKAINYVALIRVNYILWGLNANLH